MKRSVLGLLSVTAALAGLAGCGGSKEAGKVVNIWCWNNEFQGRFNAYYPDIDTTKGENGIDTKNNVTYLKNGYEVHFIIHANDNNGYQIPLDAQLQAQKDSKSDEKDDDKIDMFLLEADYATKYVKSEYTMDVADLGITAEDTKEMYDYTKTITSDGNKLKALSWQATPGLYAFRSDLAAQIWDDYPADTAGAQAQSDFVQAKLANWDKFGETAAIAKTKNIKMLSGFDDAFRVFSNNSTASWVDSNKKVTVDPQVKDWVKLTKDYYGKQYCGTEKLWSDGWKADQSSAGSVLGFFYSTWGINFTLAENAGKKDAAGSLYGKYRVCEGPASYYWGGSWLSACKGTDNADIVKDIMLKMTCDKAIAKQITHDTLDYTNNKAAMSEIANDKTYGSQFLGGQNHIKLFAESASKIKLAPLSDYDQGCNEQYQGAMRSYFLGEKTFEQANAEFETKLGQLYTGMSFADSNKTL